MHKVLNNVESVVGVLAFVALGVAGYYSYAFSWAWMEHMRSRGFREFTIWRLSSFAIFSRNLPVRCSILRRRLLLAMACFIVLCGLLALVIAAQSPSGFSS